MIILPCLPIFLTGSYMTYIFLLMFVFSMLLHIVYSAFPRRF